MYIHFLFCPTTFAALIVFLQSFCQSPLSPFMLRDCSTDAERTGGENADALGLGSSEYPYPSVASTSSYDFLFINVLNLETMLPLEVLGLRNTHTHTPTHAKSAQTDSTTDTVMTTLDPVSPSSCMLVVLVVAFKAAAMGKTNRRTRSAMVPLGMVLLLALQT
jgi:hypothetical protein